MIIVRYLLLYVILAALYGCVIQENCIAKHSEYEVITREKPVYPTSAYEEDIEGWTVISLTITDEGKASDVIVIESNPDKVFDEASVRAGSKMEFKPRVINCKPIPVYDVQYRHNFTLED